MFKYTSKSPILKPLKKRGEIIKGVGNLTIFASIMKVKPISVALFIVNFNDK